MLKRKSWGRVFLAFVILYFCITSCLATIPVIPKCFGVDFHTSMEITNAYKRGSAEKNNRWQKLKNLYDQAVASKAQYPDIPRIPYIIHQIWIGSPLPQKYISLQQSWIKNHPNWQYILWTDKEISNFLTFTKKAYDSATNYGAKSDIARYEILYRLGGLYIDTDFQCLQPFDVFHHCCDFYAGSNHEENHFLVFNGLIGAVPGHPVLKKCLDYL